MTYKFLLFDLDHTLLDFDSAEDIALTQLLKEEGVTDIQAYKDYYCLLYTSILLKALPQFSRISFNLWNSAVAIITAGTLFRGIVNLSGRSTALDAPYWYVGIGFSVLAILSIFIKPFLTNQRTKVIEG